MKTRCAVYQYYKNDRPIGYCNLDLSDLDRLSISYSTYRRLARLCSDGVSFYIVAPIGFDCYCYIGNPSYVGHLFVRVFPVDMRGDL